MAARARDVPDAGLERELCELALAAEGWPAILERLAQRIGTPVRLVGVHGGILAATDGVDTMLTANAVAEAFDADTITKVHFSDGWVGCALPVHAAERRVGLLVAGGAIDRSREPLLRAGALAVAIEAVRRDAVATAQAESASRLVDELRYGTLRSADEVTRTAERFGVRLDEPHAAAVFTYDGPNQRTWSTALSWLEYPVRQDAQCGWTVLAGDISGELTRIRTRLQGMVGVHPVLAASGPVVVGMAETPRSFVEAQMVLALLRRRADERELAHSSLGLTQLLLAAPPERLRAFVDLHLGPLLDRPELLETLDEWLDSRGSRAVVAERLNIHRNSVGYRLERIRALIDVDPSDPEIALRLRTAFAARELLLATSA